MCWCFNVRDHTLTTKSLVPMHRYPESGAVREYNHFPIFKFTWLVHGYRRTFWGGFQLNKLIFSFSYFIILRPFNIGPYIILLILIIFKLFKARLLAQYVSIVNLVSIYIYGPIFIVHQLIKTNIPSYNLAHIPLLNFYIHYSHMAHITNREQRGYLPTKA
jgi:hypothetical protein